MVTSAAKAKLKLIPVDSVRRNPENPRLLFRQEEMDELLESIRTYGIQVPVSVYEERNRYVLIDGERRWRCAVKLNLSTIPALVQDKPDRLTNILLMFNIHAMREQWDLLTIALKLKDVIHLLAEKLSHEPNESEIAKHTGMKRGVVRRCRLLLGLPDKYTDMMLTELAKPKRQQRFTEDFFIEMERALTTVERAMPDLVGDKEAVRRVLIKKFRRGVIPNRIDFRQMGKIARAANVDADAERAATALTRLFQDNRYSIREAFEDSVSGAYTERDILTRIRGLIERLRALRPDEIDEELRAGLGELLRILRALVRG